MIINCIIIEDEPLATKKLRGFVLQIEHLKLLAEFTNAIDALNYMKNNSVDLIFLDIRMKKLTGMQLLESLKVKPKVIITSAYDEYAIKGYELDVTDYLLKPFSFDRFIKAFDKVYNELSAKSDTNEEYSNKVIFVKTEYRIEKIELSKILYIQGMKDYLNIVTNDKKVMTLLSFKKIIEMLPKNEFVRVHNSYIVSIDKIENIERHRIKICDTRITISESYKEEFYKLLNSTFRL